MPSSAPARRSIPTKYFVFSSDTLVNLNTGDPNVTTTGPASIDPDTGKPYGYLARQGFPIVSIRDFIEVQKKLVDSLGIKKLHMVGGASMGGTPDLRVGGRLSRHGGQDHAGDLVGRGRCRPDRLARHLGDADPARSQMERRRLLRQGTAARRFCAVAEDRHAARADQRLGDGCVRLQVGQGRREPAQVASPTATWSRRRSTTPASARAKTSDANSFLYLVRANQLFAEGAAERIKAIKAPALLIYSPGDLVFPADGVRRTARGPQGQRRAVELVELHGNRGHLDGVLNIKQAEKSIAAFLAK